MVLVTLYQEKKVHSSLLKILSNSAQKNAAITAIVVQERHLPKSPKKTIYGELPSQVVASESGLHYQLSLDRNQNHGF